MVRLNNGIQSPSSFSQRNVCENDEGARQARREFKGLRFSKPVLETFFSSRADGTSFDNVQFVDARHRRTEPHRIRAGLPDPSCARIVSATVKSSLGLLVLCFGIFWPSRVESSADIRTRNIRRGL